MKRFLTFVNGKPFENRPVSVSDEARERQARGVSFELPIVDPKIAHAARVGLIAPVKWAVGPDLSGGPIIQHDDAISAPIELVRQRTGDFNEGYRAGYDDGLNGNASDSESAWSAGTACAELANL
jgi:hypothetical protein